MEAELLEVLKDAIETRQRNEDLDRSIGRALRRRHKDFEAYVKMTSELRELARRKDISVDDAARVLLSQHE